MNQATAIRFNPIVEWATDRAMRLIAILLTGRRLKTVVAGGLEHVPYQGPALLVARHYHHGPARQTIQTIHEKFSRPAPCPVQCDDDVEAALEGSEQR